MKKSLLLTAALAAVISAANAQASANAQAPAAPVGAQAYGKVDVADLAMKNCEFEKDANAEVLFDKGLVYFDMSFNMFYERHTRIKIFNDKAKDKGNITIDFNGGNRDESVYGVEAETINLVDGKPQITKIDKKQIITQAIDEVRSRVTFSMPNVQAGSIIEYKYKEAINTLSPPDWDFQDDIPTRYSELTTAFPDFLIYDTQPHNIFAKVNVTHTSEGRSTGAGVDAITYNEESTKRVMTDVPSLQDEPYMTSRTDNLSGINFKLSAITYANFNKHYIDSWARLGGYLSDDESFGGQLKRKVNGEEAIITKAKALKNNDAIIASVFNEVKNDMKWNDIDRWYTNDGTYRAWEKKSGNATEINLILYHLLKQSGVDAYPMIVSTRDHGKVNPSFPFLQQFNRTVVYVPVDTAHFYVLDASDKYNVYNEVPYNLLNSSGLYIDRENKKYDIVFLSRAEPVRQAVYVDAQVKPDGKIEGSAQIQNTGYTRQSIARNYKLNGEKKYIEGLRDGDNSLVISSIKFDNMDVDTLPLTQKIVFNMDAQSADGTFIYLNPNILTSLKNNPFLSENRTTNIDFGYNQAYSISELLALPTGFKVEALPKSISMSMPDNSITFRRLVAEQDGKVMVRYVISYQKSVFFKENYPEFKEFYKKMNEFLNEQVVFKKS